MTQVDSGAGKVDAFLAMEQTNFLIYDAKTSF